MARSPAPRSSPYLSADIDDDAPLSTLLSPSNASGALGGAVTAPAVAAVAAAAAPRSNLAKQDRDRQKRKALRARATIVDELEFFLEQLQSKDEIIAALEEEVLALRRGADRAVGAPPGAAASASPLAGIQVSSGAKRRRR
jgi:hypothetical protein